jgi:methionyl-tRNA formyltransferase
MKIIFMGSQEFSVEFLKELMNHGYDITYVFTREPKPAGRNQKITKTPVHEFAEKNNLKIETPKSLKKLSAEDFEKPDFIVVVGYGLILPKHFIDYPKIACLNVHPSLLPRWRGACPIERSLWFGDKETAATIMLMDEGLDTGDLLSYEKMKIDDNDNFETLGKKLSDSAKKQLIDVINRFHDYTPIKQNEDGMTYADKLKNEDRRVDLDNSDNTFSCYDIHNKIRALSSKSGLIIKLKNLDEEFKIFESRYEISPSNSEELKDLKDGYFYIKNKKLCIKFHDGLLFPKILQRMSGKGTIISDKDFINYLNNKK